MLLLVGVALMFWRLWGGLPSLWLGPDGYYTHGFIVPLVAGYIAYKRWPLIKDIPIKAFWPALIPLAMLFYVQRIASMNNIDGLMSLALMATLLLVVWTVAGGRWMFALAPSILYLSFALPLWTAIINNYTNPLQVYSTQIAYYFLRLFNFYMLYSPATEPTIIYMGNMTLNVEVPCSGLKLALALTAFTVFFILIARLRWWANLVMLSVIIPLAVLINGLRIGLVGLVGETVNPEAGMQFHEWNGYVTLLLCFFLLFKLARLLGWRDLEPEPSS